MKRQRGVPSDLAVHVASWNIAGTERTTDLRTFQFLSVKGDQVRSLTLLSPVHLHALVVLLLTI